MTRCAGCCAWLALGAWIAGTAQAEELRWYKGNTHTHTLWSDGNDFPDMVAAWYKENGYDFLALSDHNVLQAGEKWVSEAAIEKRRGALGRPVLEKYRARFGADWAETRESGAGQTEVRLKTLDEIRSLLEEPGEFLLVQAEEVSASFGKVPIHINAIHLSETIKPVNDLISIRETMRRNLEVIAEEAIRTGRPILAHVNHPNFRWALTAEDLAHVLEEGFVEVFNGHPSVFNEGAPDRASSDVGRMWDIANTLRLVELRHSPLFALATDDSHQYHGGTNTPGRGWIMVRAAKLEAGELVKAIRRGDYYATTGVVLEQVEFDAQEGELRIRIQGEPGVQYVTEFRGTRKDYGRAVKEVAAPPGDPHPVRLEYSEEVGQVLARDASLAPVYRLRGDELYVRAVIRSSQEMRNPVEPGQKQQAWTQPVGWRLDG